MWGRRRKICREGVYYLLMLVGVFVWALIREANLLLLVAGLLTAPLVLNWWLAKRSLRGIEVRRRVPHSVTAGLALHVELEVRNTRPRLGAWGLTIQDRVRLQTGSTRFSELHPQLFLLGLAAGVQRRSAYRLTLPQRGRYRLGPLTLSSRFPFGLFRCVQAVPDEAILTVYPRMGQLSPAWHRRYDPLVQGARGARRAGRAPGDFFAVREWQVGDSPRWIHWRRSARQGELIVRQFEQPGDRRLVLLVDLWQPVRAQPQDREFVELVISFVATVVADLCRRPGFQLRVGLTGAPPIWIRGAANPGLMSNALERLAVAEASAEDHLPQLLAEAQEDGENAEILVVSPRAGLPQTEHWFSQRSGRFAGRVRALGPLEPKLSEYFQLPRDGVR